MVVGRWGNTAAVDMRERRDAVGLVIRYRTNQTALRAIAEWNRFKAADVVVLASH